MDTLPEKIFVIAGNVSQFNMFKRQLVDCLNVYMDIRVHHSDIVYISTPDMIRGYRGYDKPWGYLVGTWEKREDLWQIVDMINTRGSTITEDFIEVAM